MASGKIKRSAELFKQAWRVLRENPSLMIFPIFSTLALLAVLASFALPVILSDELRGAFAQLAESQRAARHGVEATSGNASGGEKALAIAMLFAFYLVTSFVTIFFNAALLGAANRKFRGESATVGDGFSVAMSRLPQILGWALVSAIIGTILRALEERVGFLGRIVIALVGTAWAIATYFAVPALVIEGVGPIAALRRSVAIIKKTWGEGLVLAVGFGVIGFVVILAAIGMIAGGIVLGVILDSPALAIALGSLGALALLGWLVVSSTLRSIVQVALYRFATDGQIPDGFNGAALQAAFARK